MLTAFTKAEGPTFYNATAETIQIDATLDEGPNFRAELPFGEELGFPYKRQVQDVEVKLGNGETLHVTHDAVIKLRGRIEDPRNQVLVIDGADVCVMEESTFKRTPGNAAK